MDKIILPAIDIMACHGVEERERTAPQPFHIEVELELDLQPAAERDDLRCSVHYGKLYARVKKEAEEQSFALIEALAQHLAALCLEYETVEKARVTVEKQRAEYEGLTFPARVVIERSRI